MLRRKCIKALFQALAALPRGIELSAMMEDQEMIEDLLRRFEVQIAPMRLEIAQLRQKCADSAASDYRYRQVLREAHKKVLGALLSDDKAEAIAILKSVIEDEENSEQSLN